MNRYLSAALFALITVPALASQPPVDHWADDSTQPWYVGAPGGQCKPITILLGAMDPTSLEKVLREQKAFKQRTELPPGGAWIFELPFGHLLFVVRGEIACNAVIKGAE